MNVCLRGFFFTNQKRTGVSKKKKNAPQEAQYSVKELPAKFFVSFVLPLLVAALGHLCESLVKALEDHAGAVAHDPANRLRVVQTLVGDCAEGHQEADVHQNADSVAILLADRKSSLESVVDVL